MRSKAEKARIKRTKWERYMKRVYGPNWRSLHAGQQIITTPHDWEKRIGWGALYDQVMAKRHGPPLTRALTIEEIRLQLKRSQNCGRPLVNPNGYTEGVSPNARTVA